MKCIFIENLIESRKMYKYCCCCTTNGKIILSQIYVHPCDFQDDGELCGLLKFCTSATLPKVEVGLCEERGRGGGGEGVMEERRAKVYTLYIHIQCGTM